MLFAEEKCGFGNRGTKIKDSDIQSCKKKMKMLNVHASDVWLWYFCNPCVATLDLKQDSSWRGSKCTHFLSVQ